MATLIKEIKARETFSERGILGLEVTVVTDNGVIGKATPSSGVSTGEYEADFVLDGGSRYGGKGLTNAVRNVNEKISPALIGMNIFHQREIDQIMIALDGTPKKSNLGANAIVGVSLAVIKAAANSAGLPLYQYIGGPNACTLPIPVVYVGIGGRYREIGDSRWFKPSFEYLPFAAGSFSKAHEDSWNITKELHKIITEHYDKGPIEYDGEVKLSGYIDDDRQFLDYMTEAIIRAGYEGKVGIYIDMASGCYYEKEIDRYVGFFSKGEKDREQMIKLYEDLVRNYPVLSIEDPLNENDFEGHAILTRELGIEIVGDDLFTTNIERLKTGITHKAANSMVLKISQVGTVSEALEATSLCMLNGYNIHPCGSRGDAQSIVDFAVGLNAGLMRGGVSEANAGNRRGLEIEEELGNAAVWPGKKLFKGIKNQS